MISEYISANKKNTSFEQKRNQQNKYWLSATINDALKERFYKNPIVQKQLELEIEQLKNGKTTPFYAAKRLLEL